MKRRIEVWVDADFINDNHFETERLMIEQAVWACIKSRFISEELRNIFVQANEVALPLPSHGTREDYVEYKESQARCTSM